MAADEQERSDPIDNCSPDKLFERRWVETLLARVSQRPRREYGAAGQQERFEALKPYLLDDGDPTTYVETAGRLQLSESAVKSAIFKLRKRHGEVFRAEVAHTVASSSEVEDEIQWILSALGAA